jgi:hypothetical protein
LTNSTKLFTVVILRHKSLPPWCPTLIFAGNATAYSNRALTGLILEGRLLGVGAYSENTLKDIL